jgi:hypothetical protein
VARYCSRSGEASGVKPLSKSKLVAFRQCPKRLWLEIHKPELAEVSAKSEAIFRTGHQVGDIARQLYDPVGAGALLDLKSEGVRGAIARTTALLSERRPIFEAGFAAAGGLAFADALLPNPDGQTWRMVEVKASGSVKEYQRDDVAIQSYVAKAAGLQLSSVALAHIDTKWTYPGGGDYRGLLREADLSEEASSRSAAVRGWIAEAQLVAKAETPPAIDPGAHCTDPFDCSFSGHCNEGRQQPQFPVQWLPRIQTNALKAHIADNDVSDMTEVPLELLNEVQQRVRSCTLTGSVYFDQEGARADLAPYPLPALFLDFETINFGVPIWAGTRPYQQIPFQFSVHGLDASGSLHHTEFLDLSGEDPSAKFAKSLVSLCGSTEPVFVYNAGFEGARLSELAARFPDLARALLLIKSRLVDLWPIAVRRYYHPSQQGSWSIKQVLPALVPALKYEDLDGVAGGGMAQEAFLEAIHSDTTSGRREDLRRQLLAYCRLDTLAMLEIWRVFSGQDLGGDHG